MTISAHVVSTATDHQVTVATSGRDQLLAIPPKMESGGGSGVNGGELLFLALATCYCNDLYREARKRGIAVDKVDVFVDGDFAGEGEKARRIDYRVSVLAQAEDAEIQSLIQHTDGIAEIHNTVRNGCPVTLQCQTERHPREN